MNSWDLLSYHEYITPSTSCFAKPVRLPFLHLLHWPILRTGYSSCYTAPRQRGETSGARCLYGLRSHATPATKTRVKVPVVLKGELNASHGSLP